MPYVPTGDRPLLDQAVEVVANDIALGSSANFSLLALYRDTFVHIGAGVRDLAMGSPVANVHPLAAAIFNEASKYGYDGAMLGELNYAITRVIQRVPQIKVANKQWKDTDELRYWLYAITVEALVYTSQKLLSNGFGVAGVFEDIKDEYKIRVNQGYEAAQIIKSGDCYDTPFYSKLIEVRDSFGKFIGHTHIVMPRSEETKNLRVLSNVLVVNRPEEFEAPANVAEVKRGRGRPKKVVVPTNA